MKWPFVWRKRYERDIAELNAALDDAEMQLRHMRMRTATDQTEFDNLLKTQRIKPEATK